MAPQLAVAARDLPELTRCGLSRCLPVRCLPAASSRLLAALQLLPDSLGRSQSWSTTPSQWSGCFARASTATATEP